MLVIVSSRFDCEAAALVTRWASDDAVLLTCEDLSTPGWRHFSDNRRSSTAVLNGVVVPTVSIRGVLMRRSWIFEAELPYLSAVDRQYAAEEMNAFLMAWLMALQCPVFNRPTAGVPVWTKLGPTALGTRSRKKSRACGWRRPPLSVIRGWRRAAEVCRSAAFPVFDTGRGCRRSTRGTAVKSQRAERV
jgi:hypothetical protein